MRPVKDLQKIKIVTAKMLIPHDEGVQWRIASCRELLGPFLAAKAEGSSPRRGNRHEEALLCNDGWCAHPQWQERPRLACLRLNPPPRHPATLHQPRKVPRLSSQPRAHLVTPLLQEFGTSALITAVFSIYLCPKIWKGKCAKEHPKAWRVRFLKHTKPIRLENRMQKLI